MKMRIIICFLCLLLLLYGCSSLRTSYPVSGQPAQKTIEDPYLTEHILTVLKQRNQEIRSFKGIGRIEISDLQARRSARFAFAGQERKLRVEILDIAGQPLVSLAYDGNWLYLVQHAENRFYQKKSLAGDLRQFITIPLTIRELVALLSGRVPLIEYASATLERDPGGQGYRLTLNGRWLQRDREHISLAPDMKTVRRYERLDGRGRLVYAADVKSEKQAEGHWIPQRLSLADTDQHQLLMDIETWRPNANVDASMFVLEKPDTAIRME
jgi:outer membrane biogenesis lipoprotein LolB